MRKKLHEPRKGEAPGYFEMIFPLKPGVKFSDVFMDGQQIMQEIYIKPRTLQYYRDANKISYTRAFGKYLYLRMEIAELLEKNIIWRRSS